MIVVCDSTVLIGLSRIGKLELLQDLFGQISVPRAVFVEVAGKGMNRAGAEPIKEAD